MTERPYSEYQMKIRESIRSAILELPDWKDSDPFTANYLAEVVLTKLIQMEMTSNNDGDN